MATYLQLGHESWSLLEERDIGAYAGVVLSPVNDDPQYVAERLGRLGAMRNELEVILDPQLYNPGADKGRLPDWPYFPTDFDTADRSEPRWWAARGADVVRAAVNVGADAVCTPAPIPRVGSDEYYRLVVETGDAVKLRADAAEIDTLLTVIIRLRDIADPAAAFRWASILSATDCDRIYLIFLEEDVPQREPLRDSAAIAGAVHLIRLLSGDVDVHVAFCAHDLVVWKFSGATHVSTGKWMNVRRFSPSRWKEEDTTGRQVAYWNEGKLLTLLRDQDVTRLDREGWFEGREFGANPASSQILDILRRGTGQAWLKLSWIQYLRWASNVEAAINAEDDRRLVRADESWAQVEQLRILFIDRFNNGDHARIWLGAAREGAGR